MLQLFSILDIKPPYIIYMECILQCIYNFKLDVVLPKEILKKTPGCKVVDERKNGGYITPLEAEGNYKTFISRIRKDSSKKNAIK